MGFAWTNGGMSAQRSTATHEPRYAAAARATHRRALRHTNLIPLTCLLEHPLWRLAGSVEAAATRQLSGGGDGERAGSSEEAAW